MSAERTCRWHYECISWDDAWETECGQAYCVDADLREHPETHGYTYCPHCGRRIVWVATEEDEEDQP